MPLMIRPSEKIRPAGHFTIAPLSAALALRDEGVTLPKIVLISPSVDLTMANRDIPKVQPKDPITLVGATDAVLAISRAHRPSMLVIQSDDHAAVATDEIAAIEQLCVENGSTECFATSDPEEGEAFGEARRMAIPSMERHGTLLLEDVTVPIPRLGELVLGIEAISAAHDVPIALIAHAGHGNTHLLLVYNASDDAQKERAHIAFGDVMDLAISLGGTITGEHGVGRLKQPWLADYLGPDVLKLNERIKHALDPHNIFNPGAVLIRKGEDR